MATIAYKRGGFQMMGKRMVLSAVLGLGMLLTMSAGVVAPDSEAGTDSGTSVTVNVVNPRINTCSFWNAGPNAIIDIGSDDINLTDMQTDVDSIPAGNLTYFLVNVSMFAGNGLLDLESVNVTAWFDNGTETDYSMNWPRSYPNRNITINYSFNDGSLNLLYPLTGEFTAPGAAVIGFTNSTTQEIALPFRMGPNVRWAPGDGAWNTAPGWNDIDSWNFRCTVTLDAGGDPLSWSKPWHQAEFGLYKLTSLSVSGSPSTSLPPGAPWTAFSASPDQSVTYTSNAPFNLTVNITDLSGPGSLTSDNLAVDGENLFPYKPFWDDTGTGDGYNFLAGANGTSYSSYEYIDAGNTNLTDGGATAVEWYAKVPIGTLEGTYTATISWNIRTSTDPSP